MNKEEILTSCIEDIRSGKSTLEECTARYPELGEELISLLEIAVCIKPDDVSPSPDFKQRVQRHLFEERQPSPAELPHGLWFWPKHTAARILASALTVLVVLSTAGAGTAYAAQSSLPGDTLYPVKTAVENFRLATTPDPLAKANLHAELTQLRVDEVTQQVKLNRPISTQAIDKVKEQYDSTVRELNNSDNLEAINDTLSRLSASTLEQQLELEKVLSGASEDTQSVVEQVIGEVRRGNTIAQVAYANHDFLTHRPSVTDERLDVGQFEIEGTLISIHGTDWNVGGTIIENVQLSGKTPPVGSRLKLEGLIKDNNAFISRIETTENSAEPTRVEGQFGGTNSSGVSDVSGIKVKIGDDSSEQLRPGDNVRLEGKTSDDKLNVTSRENNADENSDGAIVSGVLTAVNNNSETITVRTTGNQITINLSQARIENKNDSRETLRLSDLNRLIGRNIKLEGLSKKDTVLYARRVRVETRK